MQRQHTEQLSNFVFEDLLNTLNVSKRFVEISFADKGTSSFNTAHYYDELTDVDLQYLLKKTSNLSFLNCMDPSTTLVPMGILTKRIGVAQCIKERNIISFDVDGKDLLKNFKEMSSEEQRNYLKTLSNQVLEKCKNLKLPLWLLVFSGHGFHLHFRTKNLIPFNTALDYKNFYDSIREYLEGLIPGVKFDRACNNIARLMRLPGSTNWKDAQQAIPTEFWFHDSVFSDDFFAKIHIKVKDMKTPQSLGKRDIEKNLDLRKILKHFHYAKEDTFQEFPDKIICSSPFNQDSTPSFHYNKVKRQFFDFSTGCGGDFFHLIGSLSQLNCKEDFPTILKIAKEIIGISENLSSKKQRTSKESGFVLREEGLYGIEIQGEDEFEHWICAPLQVLAYSRDYTNQSWGRLLSFKDPDSVEKFWSMPMEYLATDGTEIRKNLLNMGLEIATDKKSRNLLLEYIRCEKPDKKVRCVDKIGWHGEQFVLPREVFSKNMEEQVVFQGDYLDGFQCEGTLEEWHKFIGEPCQGQALLTFVLCLSFAPTILHLLGEENAGFHLVGSSSIGKTIALKVAASVWGKDFMHKWRATVNGLEAVAESRNDSLLILDEIGEINPKDAGAAVYMLGNGAGKRRAGKEGSLRASKQWRTIFLSSGEVELSTHLAEDQKTVRGGQEIRCIDLEADMGQGFGVLSEAENHKEACLFMDELRQNSQNYFGTPIKIFLEYLVKENSIHLKLREKEQEFLNSLGDIPPSNQVHRVLKKFSIVAAAGVLASEFGVLPHQKEEIFSAVGLIFKNWLNGKNSIFDSETRTIVSQVRMFLQTYGSTHFPLFEDLNTKFEGKFYGFRKANSTGDYDWYVLNEVFKKEACKGFDIRTSAKVLQNAKLLCIKGDRSSIAMRIPHLGHARFYIINSSVLN